MTVKKIIDEIKSNKNERAIEIWKRYGFTVISFSILRFLLGNQENEHSAI